MRAGNNRDMRGTQAGGAAMIGGVVYQMLWSLLELTSVECCGTKHDSEGVLTGAVLILEPSGGGGDARIEGPGVHIVIQLKARDRNRTWSLQEVIKKVLPDLLKAVKLDCKSPEYRFVTDGRIGDWNSIQRFFRSLRGLGDTEIERLLDAPDTLHVGARFTTAPADVTPFWDKATYTRRELVDKVIQTLGCGLDIQDPSEFRQKILHLLAYFEFCEPLTVQDAEERIDAALSEKADYVEDVPLERKRLLQELAELARSGNVKIELGSFLEKAGLDALPANHIGEIVARGQQVLFQRLRTLRFLPQHHVQGRITDVIAKQVREWPITLVTGASGAGKSWHCCAVAELLARQGAIVAHIDAEGSAPATLDRAMGVLWNSVKGNDKILPYDRAARRLYGPPPIRILVIDRVDDAFLARDLAVVDCEGLKLRLVLGCSTEAADAAQGAVPKRCHRLEAEQFTPPELNDYLAARGVWHWQAIPADVRAILQMPLLASVFCDAMSGDLWRPTNEYELLDRYWQSRLGPASRTDRTLDVAFLRELGRDFVAGNPYPWSADRMHALVKHERAFHRVTRSGILTVRSDGACEIWHDRLLNWLVAITITEDVVSGHRSPLDVGTLCANAMRGTLRPSGKRLGYVPMDTLWHLAGRGQTGAAAAVLAALEGTA